MHSHRTLTARSRLTIDPIKGSRFAATLGPVRAESEAREFVTCVRAEWPNASHHCWAWRLSDGRSRSSDDGEPGGSAGRPILAQLEGHDVQDAVVVVTRWYGGTKLGMGGLMRAYGGCAGKALDAADVIEIARTVPMSLTHAYADTGAVQATLRSAGLTPESTAFGAEVIVQLSVPASDADTITRQLMDATAGRVRVNR
ncbi:MAG: YigZ family protein [Myxococcota bacterium]|nr:YigZ family protein [Myxococcota bacterium]